MNIQEFNEVKNMSYRQYCKYLQEKYDAIDCERKDYYHFNNDGNYTKTSKTSCGCLGLQYHHICEDEVADLSIITVANEHKDHPEYQQAENMCYCNLLEHMFLHILIAESQKEDSNGKYVGDGGVKWMVLALNSIYSNPTTSWYSKKGAYKDLTKEEKEQVDEVRGLEYNHNNIITDNKETYLALVNRYCTSAFIRIKLNSTPELIAKDLCIACKEDRGVQNIYLSIYKAAGDTKLFDWNIVAFADLETYLRNDKTALVKICTGGGKTTTALEYLRLHDCKALVLGSANTIQDSWINDKTKSCFDDKITYKNYQTFMNIYKDINWDNYDVLICDEAHHISAEDWGKGVKWALANTNIKVIGLTATPNNEQYRGTDAEFKGRICYGLDLARGIKEGTIFSFGYVQSIYKLESMRDEFNSYGPTGIYLWEKLCIKANENPIEKILKDNMPVGKPRKIIVFIQNIDGEKSDLEDVKKALIKYNPKFVSEDYMRFIASKESNKEVPENERFDENGKKLNWNDASKRWFNNTNDHDVCLITRDMVNEGAHYKGVNTLIMFRSTNSNRLFLQQLGRIVVPTKDNEDPNGMVFDFTNNAQMLIAKSKSMVNFIKKEEVENGFEEEDTDKDKNTCGCAGTEIKNILEEIKNHHQVIYKDYTENCVEVLTSLMQSGNASNKRNLLYSAYITELKNIDMPSEFFEFDLWKNAQTDANDTDKINLARRTGNGGTSTTTTTSGSKPRERSVTLQRGQIKAKDAEKVAMALELVLKRGYNFQAIDFEDTTKCPLIIKDEKFFEEIIKDVGFKSYEPIINVIKNLKQSAFIIAKDWKVNVPTEKKGEGD